MTITSSLALAFSIASFSEQGFSCVHWVPDPWRRVALRGLRAGCGRKGEEGGQRGDGEPHLTILKLARLIAPPVVPTSR